MLFHITHTHTEVTCPYHKDEVRNRSFGSVLKSMGDAGLKIVGGWSDPPGHRMFFVVDADRAEQIYQGLAPIVDQGTAAISPVTDFAQAIGDIAARRS